MAILLSSLKVLGSFSTPNLLFYSHPPFPPTEKSSCFIPIQVPNRRTIDFSLSSIYIWSPYRESGDKTCEKPEEGGICASTEATPNYLTCRTHHRVPFTLRTPMLLVTLQINTRLRKLCPSAFKHLQLTRYWINYVLLKVYN